jgi:hypothetical protein
MARPRTSVWPTRQSSEIQASAFAARSTGISRPATSQFATHRRAIHTLAQPIRCAVYPESSPCPSVIASHGCSHLRHRTRPVDACGPPAHVTRARSSRFGRHCMPEGSASALVGESRARGAARTSSSFAPAWPSSSTVAFGMGARSTPLGPRPTHVSGGRRSSRIADVIGTPIDDFATRAGASCEYGNMKALIGRHRGWSESCVLHCLRASKTVLVPSSKRTRNPDVFTVTLARRGFGYLGQCAADPWSRGSSL